MLNWTYNTSTDSFQAEFKLDFETPDVSNNNAGDSAANTHTPKSPITLKLDLSHSYPGKHWFLNIKTNPESGIKFKTTIPAFVDKDFDPTNPERPDIDDIKLRAELACAAAIDSYIDMATELKYVIIADSVDPMPEKTKTVETLWHEFIRIPKNKAYFTLSINKPWQHFPANTLIRDIQAWFHENFKGHIVSKDERSDQQ